MSRFSRITLFFAACIATVGCSDQLLTAPTESSEPVQRSGELLRNGQLMGRAISSGTASKSGDDNVYAFMSYDEYEADGVTRRVLDSYGITRRILQEYGVTRRVLDSYGVTRRILQEYGVTRRVLNEYALDLDLLDRYGITTRIEDEFGVGREQLARELESFPSVIKVRLQTTDGMPGISTEIDAGYWDILLDELADDRDLAFLEPDPATAVSFPRPRHEQSQTNQLMPWNVAHIGGGATELDLSRVRVYVLDSGVNHFDLNVAESKDFTMLFLNRGNEFWDDSEFQSSNGFDPGKSGDPSDELGHGTHVAGIIGALDNDKGVVGVAPGVAIHSLKVLTADGQTDVTTLVAAIRYVMAAQEAASASERFVINLSLGMDIESKKFNVLDETIDQAIQAGIVVVVSAGNDKADASTYSPAHVPDAITVGAYDMVEQFADFSNSGLFVDLLAPGVDVASLPHQIGRTTSTSVRVQSGTSMAAPHVSAAAALILAAYPTVTPADVVAELMYAGRQGINKVPSNTTDTTVYVGFAGTNPTALMIHYSQWDSTYGVLLLSGTGRPGATVMFQSPNSDTVIGLSEIDADGNWEYSVRPNPAPCSVVAFIPPDSGENGEMAAAVVNGAPSSCI